MRKGLIAAIMIILLSCFWIAHIPASVSNPTTTFTLRVTQTLTNRGEEAFTLTEGDVSISLFMNTSWATVTIVEVSPAIEEVKQDDDGNQYAVLGVGRELPPGGSVTIEVTYNIVSRPRSIPSVSEEESKSLSDIDAGLVDLYDDPSGPWRYDEWTSIGDLALGLKGDETNVLRIVDKFIKRIENTVRYPEEAHETPLYPNETLLYAEGDCDDQASVLITMCRAVGIPAFLQIGPILSRALGKSTYSMWDGHVIVEEEYVGWHGWAMIYIPPWGWLPIDLTWREDRGTEYDYIKGAAVAREFVIPYANVTGLDYVAESKSEKARIEGSDLYINISDVMVSEVSEVGIIEALNNYWIVFSVATGAIAAVVVVAVFVIIRRGARVEEYRQPYHTPS